MFGEGPFGSVPFAANPQAAVAGTSLDLPAMQVIVAEDTPTPTVGAELAVAPQAVLVAELNSPLQVGASWSVSPLEVIAQARLSVEYIVDIMISAMPVILELDNLYPVTGVEALVTGLQVETRSIHSPIDGQVNVKLPGFRCEVTVVQTPVSVAANLPVAPLAVESCLTETPVVGSVVLVPSLQVQTALGSLVCSQNITLVLPSLRVVVAELATIIPIYHDVALSLQELTIDEFPLETIYDTNLDLSLQEVAVEKYSLSFMTQVGPGHGNFYEINRSSASMPIFGSDPNQPFKLNPVATAFRRGGPSHILQLAQTKPTFVTVDAVFKLITPFAELQPDEFTYAAPGGFLKIWNQNTIQASLIPDGDTDAIAISVTTTFAAYPQPALTSLNTKRQI